MSKSSKSISVELLSAFQNVLNHVCILGAIVTAEAYNHAIVVPPRDAVVDVGNEFINRYDIEYIRDKRGSPDSLPMNKQKMIEYDRGRASECVRSDWYSPSPRFDDRQFE
jgi:hypothetical protein